MNRKQNIVTQTKFALRINKLESEQRKFVNPIRSRTDALFCRHCCLRTPRQALIYSYLIHIVLVAIIVLSIVPCG
jgi:hypothetical protein